MSNFEIRPVTKDDRDWVVNLCTEWWASPEVVTTSGVHRPDELPGFVAVQDGRLVGLITYKIVGDGNSIHIEHTNTDALSITLEVVYQMDQSVV